MRKGRDVEIDSSGEGEKKSMVSLCKHRLRKVTMSALQDAWLILKKSPSFVRFQALLTHF